MDAWKGKNQQKQQWKMDFDISAPILILPENCADPYATALICNFGRFQFTYGTEALSPAVAQWFEARRRSHRMDSEVDHLKLEMNDLSFTISSVGEASKRRLDEVGFEIHVVEGGDIDSFDGAVDGTFIHGLYLEGGCWCDGTLQDARPKELVSKLPPLFIKVISSMEEDKDGYEAPVYYSPMRGPTYLFSSFLPCRKVSQAVLRGTALLLSPSYISNY